MKAFDLRFGQTIVIIPANGNSFYYLQLEVEPLSEDMFGDFLDQLKENKCIQEMIYLAGR
jgi:hypothetical protein